MLALKVEFKDAEKAKRKIMELGILSETHHALKTKTHIFFPLKSKPSKKLSWGSIVEEELKEKEVPVKNMKELLKELLSKEELEKLKTAHDTVGTIAILEIDDSLRHKEKDIAKALLATNKSIKTVLRKDAGHEGEFRTQKMKWLAGEKTKEAIHRENNVMLKLNVETVYFSPRLSTERKRISDLVTDGEEVLVMFSGCAPYPCVLAKNTGARRIVGVEINPEGHAYGLENLKLNNIINVELFNGDVKKVVPELGMKFDRILMPLPKSAEDFLDVALGASKKGTIIHFYYFLHEDEFSKAEEMVNEACKKAGVKWKKLDLVKCGQQAPHVFRICLDFKVL